MQNRTPVPRATADSLTDFVPVPRKHVRHDGWTPARQREFIAALADTGSVPTACRMVNMAKSRAYALRREPGAEGFRRAWDAAMDMGLQILKDEAFDRALNGQLVPMIVGGKLIGYQRKKNDALLMFLIRHFGVDANGRRVTINYFSTKATAGAIAGAGAGGAPGNDTVVAGTIARETTPGGSVRVPLCAEQRAVGKRRGKRASAAPRPAPVSPPVAAVATTAVAVSGAETSHTTMRTVITGPATDDTGVRADEAAAALAAFEGVELDDTAQSAILAALEACAARARALPVEDDADTAFVSIDEVDGAFVGTLEGGVEDEDCVALPAGEVSWEMLDDHQALDAIDAAVASVAAAKANGEWERLKVETPKPALLRAPVSLSDEEILADIDARIEEAKRMVGR